MGVHVPPEWLFTMGRNMHRWGEGSGTLPYLLAERLSVRLPCVASVDEAAASPRQLAFAKACRSSISEQQPAAPRPDADRAGWTLQDAKPRPKRLKVASAKTAADRFKQAAAKAIYELLVEEGVLRK